MQWIGRANVGLPERSSKSRFSLGTGGKIAAMHVRVSDTPAESSRRSGPTGRAPESPAFIDLRGRAGQRLLHHAHDVAARWVRQVRGAGLWPEDGAGTPALEATGTALVSAISQSLTAEGAALEAGVELGLDYGAEAFDAGASLNQALRGLDLLTAMVLYEIECAAEDEADVTAADGVRLVRRFQQGAGLLTTAAAEGYMQGVSDAMRDRFKHLRHDLRNPLGTIKSVLALMDDESVPADARSNPRFRAMASRNARSLEEMIVARLADAAAMHPALGRQLVSPRRLACAVRRDLRAEAAARDISIAVGAMGERVCLDAAALQLLIHAALLAAFQEAPRGAELRLEFGEVVNRRFAVSLASDAPGGPVASEAARQRLRELAGRMQASIEFGAALTVSMLVKDEESTSARAKAPIEQERRISDAPALRSDG